MRTIAPAPAPEEDKERERRYEIVKNLVRSKLQETGDLDKLRTYVRKRLGASGWKYNMVKELKGVVSEKGTNSVTVQDLYDRIHVIGKNVDKRVEEDSLRKIRHSYIEALSEKDGYIDSNRRNDVINNNNASHGNMRYRKNRRN